MLVYRILTELNQYFPCITMALLQWSIWGLFYVIIFYWKKIDLHIMHVYLVLVWLLGQEQTNNYWDFYWLCLTADGLKKNISIFLNVITHFDIGDFSVIKKKCYHVRICIPEDWFVFELQFNIYSQRAVNWKCFTVQEIVGNFIWKTYLSTESFKKIVLKKAICCFDTQNFYQFFM